MLLHQSNIMFGVNISFADIFCFMLLVIIAGKGNLVIPIKPIIFFMIVYIIVLLSAVYIVPVQYTITPEPTQIVSDFIKLIAILLYFLIGYNLATTNSIETGIKWYSIVGMMIGILGIILTFLNIRIFSSILFYSDIRFRGLMNDPNYFSVLQITAMVYFSRMKTIKARYRALAVLVTVVSVVTSGSKTGMITLFCYLGLRTMEYILSPGKKLRTVFLQLTVLFVFILSIPIAIEFMQQFLLSIAYKIPAFSRVYFLFTDFTSAISENGSARGATWQVATQIIQQSPLLGIGIGTYTDIAMEHFYSRNIAHNTFLQLAAEWGIPLAFLFFTYVFYILSRTHTLASSNKDLHLIYRDIIIILLVGSMAISLNNARVLWFFLGALVSTTYTLSRKKKYVKAHLAKNV